MVAVPPLVMAAARLACHVCIFWGPERVCTCVCTFGCRRVLWHCHVVGVVWTSILPCIGVGRHLFSMHGMHCFRAYFVAEHVVHERAVERGGVVSQHACCAECCVGGVLLFSCTHAWLSAQQALGCHSASPQSTGWSCIPPVHRVC